MKDISCSQIRIITRIAAAACLSSILLSYKLWLSERLFPVSPVFDFLPHLNPPFDIFLLLFTSLLLACIIIFRNPKKYIILFLICAFVLALLDQNRWQPWFYQYVSMFFILSFFNYRCDDSRHQEAIACIFKLMIGAIYFWSGLQKLNPHFLSDTYPWLMEPITDHLGAQAIDKLDWLGKAFPIIETLTGVALFFTPVKKAAVFALAFMHLFILFVLGPFGHNYNPVVWPWNIAMVLFAFILFFNDGTVTISKIKNMLRYHSLKIVTIFFIMMPLFNFINLWDSYLSHNLYSGNTSNGVIYISDEVKTKLPEGIRPYAIGESDQIQITIKYWCMKELGVPAYPEKRNFEAITKYIHNYTDDPAQIYLMYSAKQKLSDL